MRRVRLAPLAALAWASLGAVAALMIATVGLIVTGTSPSENLFFAFTLGFPIVGALIASRRPGNAVGWLLLAIGFALTLTSFVDAYVLVPDPPLGTVVAWVASWVWYMWLAVAGIFLPLVFPTGQLPSRRWRPALWLGLLAVSLSVVGNAFKPGKLEVDAATAPANPLGAPEQLEGLVTALARAGEVLTGIAFLLAAASLVARFRHARGTERQQLKWFAYVGLLALTGLTMAMVQVLFGAQPGEQAVGGALEVVGSIGWFSALGAIVVGMPVAVGMAILRHRLYDIDVVINRTLVYGALTAALLGTYVTGVLVLQLVLSPLTEDSGLAVAGSTLAVAALFRPARSRIQATVDRRFYRRKYDAEQVLEDFAHRLRDQQALETLAAELRGAVAQTVAPSGVSVWMTSAPAGVVTPSVTMPGRPGDIVRPDPTTPRIRS